MLFFLNADFADIISKQHLPYIINSIPDSNKLYQGKFSIEMKYNIVTVNRIAFVNLAVANAGYYIAVIDRGAFIYFAFTDGHNDVAVICRIAFVNLAIYNAVNHIATVNGVAFVYIVLSDSADDIATINRIFLVNLTVADVAYNIAAVN